MAYSDAGAHGMLYKTCSQWGVLVLTTLGARLFSARQEDVLSEAKRSPQGVVAKLESEMDVR